jgi:type III secretory pathway component EscS
MLPADIHDVALRALELAVFVSAPFLGAALLAGALAGALQSYTRMSEPVIGHVARAAAVLLLLLGVAGLAASSVADFAERVWSMIQDVSS